MSALNFILDFYKGVGIFFKPEVAGEEEPLEGEMEAVTQVDPPSSLSSSSSSLSFGQ